MKSFFTIIVLFLLSFTIQAKDRITILPIGDSITEGKAGQFESYLYHLWEMLYTKGYQFDFIGPRTTSTRIGNLHHCAYGGKNAEFIADQIDSIYRAFPADLVLLHSGHNHFDTEKPISGIIKAHQSIIEKIWAINPHALIFEATIIPSGKYPKYSYIPELNVQIRNLVKEANSKKLLLVDQEQDFDWERHTIDDRVHPNLEGAKKIAKTWMAAISLKVQPVQRAYSPEIVRYKEDTGYQLDLHVFRPDSCKRGKLHPAIVFFFGGGWTYGTPLQFYRECTYYASKGVVAISADYRIFSVNRTTPFDSFDDAKDAMRWLRQHAALYSIDTSRIIAAGASAGGQLAAALGTVPSTEKEHDKPEYRPDLLLLYYPVIDNSTEGYGPDIVKARYQEFSPLHNITANSPPTLFILGTEDQYVSVQTGLSFQQRMLDAGSYCDLSLIKGAKHPIFEYRKKLTSKYFEVQHITNNFLRKYCIIE